jgi:hypothetical protein
MKKKELKLRDNYNYRAVWGNYKSDKYKRKITIISEIHDILRDLVFHPTISKQDLIDLKESLKRKIYCDADQELPAFTRQQNHDYWDMHPTLFKKKWGDKL